MERHDRPALGHRGRHREAVVAGDQLAILAGLDPNHYDGTVLEKWSEKEWLDFGIENRRWTLSQFLHGEQGALLCTAKITETVPWYDAKLYAATQVVDEARHVEVFARYLEEKLGGGYQVNAHLRMLLDDIINDSRWDMTYLGMQVMVEGLALAAFGFMHQLTEEPLLKQLLRYVMSDEARHVAFGVLSLKEVYAGMTDAEMKERQEFAYEAAVRMRDRFMSQEVWERQGINPKDVLPSCSATRPATCSSRCCSPRSSPTARSSACSTATTSGCATASRRWASSSSRTSRTPARSTSSSSSARRLGVRTRPFHAHAYRASEVRAELCRSESVRSDVLGPDAVRAVRRRAGAAVLGSRRARRRTADQPSRRPRLRHR